MIAGRRPGALVAGVVAVTLIALAAAKILSGSGTYTVSADFAEAPGIYQGNAVKVLGVRVGQVSKVSPSPSGVRLTLELEKKDVVSADAVAYLMAPNAVNDRFIELVPTTTGPRLLAGGEIPRDRTVLPSSVDQIIDNLNEFSKTMGPQGANANGSLSTLLAAVAQTFGGNGSTINSTIKGLGTTLGAVSEDTDAVTTGLNSLGELTTAAAGVSGTYERFAGNLATVSEAIASDAPAIAGVLTNLQSVLSELNTFVRNNKGALAGTVTSLSSVASEVGKQQAALKRVLRTLPLAVDNVGNTITNTPSGPAVTARLNPVRNAPVTNKVCGDGLLRLMVVTLEPDPGKRKVTDVACGVNWWLTELPASPGAPNGAAFTLQALAGLGN